MRSGARSSKPTVRRLPPCWTKQGKKKLLRLVDAHTAAQEEMALSGFIAGFRLAWGIAMELGTDGKYSYEQEQEQINRLKN